MIPAQHVYKFEEDELMTRLLRDNSGPLPDSACQSLRAYLVHRAQVEHDGSLRVWCFCYKIDGLAATIWLFLALALSCACGLGVGYGKNDSQLGWSVGTGLLAVLTMINGMIVFVCSA
jgi:hypothetical protein